MSPTQRFIWGFCGSLAVEIITIYQAYHSPRIHFPQRYKRKGFWAIRTLVCVIAGGLALAYKIESEVLAINIGASAPLIMQALARDNSERPPTSEPRRLEPPPTKPRT